MGTLVIEVLVSIREHPLCLAQTMVFRNGALDSIWKMDRNLAPQSARED